MAYAAAPLPDVVEDDEDEDDDDDDEDDELELVDGVVADVADGVAAVVADADVATIFPLHTAVAPLCPTRTVTAIVATANTAASMPPTVTIADAPWGAPPAPWRRAARRATRNHTRVTMKSATATGGSRSPHSA